VYKRTKKNYTAAQLSSAQLRAWRGDYKRAQLGLEITSVLSWAWRLQTQLSEGLGGEGGRGVMLAQVLRFDVGDVVAL